MAKLSPVYNSQVFDENGDPAVGWLIKTYAAGSSSRQAAYTDASGTVPHPADIVINSLGLPGTGAIWLADGVAYKFVLTDAQGVAKDTKDNIAGVNDANVTVSQWQASSVTPTYVSATSFTVPGDQTTEFHVNRRLQLTTSAGTVYGVIASSAYATLTTVTVTLDDGALDSGLSAVNLGILRADNDALPGDVVKTSGAQAINGLKSFQDGIISSHINGGQIGGMRNRVINGNFTVNQRGVSGTVTLAAGAYGHDRWKAGPSGCTYTFAAAGNDTVITITAGTLHQVIEGANIEGGDYILSWFGTAQGRLNSDAYGASGRTANLTANVVQIVEFGTGTLSKVQLELGSVATPFERRLAGMELALCQRYYEMGSGYDASYAAAGTAILKNIGFKATKRAAPTVAFSSVTYSNSGGLASAGVGATELTFQHTIAATGRGDVGFNWAASAEL